ncbi:MAG: DUF1207 domain-containing protein, partial [Nitrospirota bacterium]
LSPAASHQARDSSLESKFHPHGFLFAPLHADPRWPHFSLAYRSISQGVGPDNTGAANFGETFALYRDAASLTANGKSRSRPGSSARLIWLSRTKTSSNADYTAGLLTSYGTRSFSSFLRVHHQSSHLGDEFILNSLTPVNRINLSFEEIDLKLSYELSTWLRVYGGGGVLVDRDPKILGRGTSQFGAELTSTWTLLGGKFRPVAYGDVQANERTSWTISRSVMAGVQFENARIGDRKVQVLLEYFKGSSPNGQFFTHSTGWIGLGLHLYY